MLFSLTNHCCDPQNIFSLLRNQSRGKRHRASQTLEDEERPLNSPSIRFLNPALLRMLILNFVLVKVWFQFPASLPTGALLLS